jgi:Pilus formation protein N terminal region
VNLASIARPATAAAIVAMSVVAIPEASAQEPTTIQSGPVQPVAGSAQRITMTMGKGELFKTSVPYTKISVSDEKIVDVTPQSNQEFVFTPRGIGSTNVFVFDEKSKLIATLDINVVGTAQEARAETYNEIPGRVRIYNVRGSFAKPAFYRCNLTNCELVNEATNAGPGPSGEAPNAGPGPSGEAPNAGPGPAGAATAGPKGGATP